MMGLLIELLFIILRFILYYHLSINCIHQYSYLEFIHST